jgi:hypothetical protein
MFHKSPGPNRRRSSTSLNLSQRALTLVFLKLETLLLLFAPGLSREKGLMPFQALFKHSVIVVFVSLPHKGYFYLKPLRTEMQSFSPSLQTSHGRC